ncbi:conjugal transfer nickase/helicase domain-containing protein [Escherichia coli]|uniref:conjugal transfer nickase/helicase domain-containing protein n=1 Tax=Escherichia coli TaxID=562 RepID=UPI00357135CA
MSAAPVTFENRPDIHWQGQKLVVNAFAGTGKTSTLVQYALVNPDSRMLYLAYNRSVRDEAERKFPFNVECKTSHQLAWSRFGRHYQNRLVASLRITDVARKLNTRHWLLVRLALSSLNQFLCSADTEPGLQHLPDEDARAGTDVSAILKAVQVLWHEMSRPDGTFPVTHDTYLKLFQLTEAVTAPLLSENTVQPEDNVPSDSQPETSTGAIAPEMPAAVPEVGEFTLQPSVSGTDEAEAVVPDTLQSATGAEEKAPEEQSVHDDTDMLLSLFSAADDHAAVVTADGECLQETQVLIDNDHSQRKHEDASLTLISGSSAPEAVISEGEMFINWLKKGVRNGEISLNGKKDKIHIVAGFVFLPVPGIFYEFTKAAGIPADKKDDIQASFERLSIHKRRDNRRFYFAHLCEEPENRSRFKTLKGYLVKGRQLLDGQELQDSRYLFFP